MMNPSIVRVDDQPPQPWKNGGGTTRELLAWPEAQDWTLRISVADITASGPFSEFAGVERWFAVLRGDGVQLATPGSEAATCDTTQSALHRFPGELPTWCTALGTANRDFNLMLRRERGQLQQQPLCAAPQLTSSADLVALFVVDALTVQTPAAECWRVPDMALIAWENPEHHTLRLHLQPAGAPVRGWWIELRV